MTEAELILRRIQYYTNKLRDLAKIMELFEWHVDLKPELAMYLIDGNWVTIAWFPGAMSADEFRRIWNTEIQPMLLRYKILTVPNFKKAAYQEAYLYADSP